MRATVVLPVWAFVAWIVFKILSRFVEARQHAVKAKELGCQEAPMAWNSGFLGIKAVRRTIKAAKEKNVLGYWTDRARKMSEVHGYDCTTYRVNKLGQIMYFTSDPKNIQAILATNFNDFSIGQTRRANMRGTIGDGIFVQDGPAWAHSRALLRPSFAREQVADLDLEERHLQNFMNVVKMEGEGWTAETNIQQLFFRFTIDTATEFLFGESVLSQLAETYNPSVHSMSNEKAEQSTEKSFSTNFDSATQHLALRTLLGDKYWLHNPKEFRQNNKGVNDFLSQYVDLALKRRSDEKYSASNETNKYIFLDALAQQTQDPTELRAQLLNILLAGRDTTAALLSWFFHEMLRNPAVFAKLRETIVEDFGTYNDQKEISFSTLKGSQYLQNCLSETLRLWASVPVNSRRSVRATTLPRGGGPDGESPIYIKPQTEVTYCIHIMHRGKEIWGPDAEEFKPERFQGRRHGWEFLPFNGGPRICIGQQFALTEASYVIVRLLQRFDRIEPGVDELQGPVLANLALTNAPAKSVTLRFHEAE